VRGADRAASTQLADPGPQHTAFANGTADHSAQKTVPTVLATYWPPSGKRKFGLIVVGVCPFCARGGHHHRGDGGLRDSGCGLGTYFVTSRPAITARTARVAS
jgi:hypothetical protein